MCARLPGKVSKFISCCVRKALLSCFCLAGLSAPVALPAHAASINAFPTLSGQTLQNIQPSGTYLGAYWDGARTTATLWAPSGATSTISTPSPSTWWGGAQQLQFDGAATAVYYPKETELNGNVCSFGMCPVGAIGSVLGCYIVPNTGIATSGGSTTLLSLNPNIFVVTRAVSADGSTIVGDMRTDDTFQYQLVLGGPIFYTTPRPKAFRWTQAAGIQDLGTLAGDNWSEARGVSQDGSVVVGQSAAATFAPDGTFVSAGDEQAFRWTQADGMAGLGKLAGAAFSRAYGVSGDGSTVVGASGTGAVYEAFRWTQATGMTGLGKLTGASTSVAKAASGDGSIIVGQSGTDAFRWTSADGMQKLSDYLTSRGANLSYWTALTDATGIAYDGKTIVGFGTHSGSTEAFYARDTDVASVTSLDNSLQQMSSIGPMVSSIGQAGLANMMNSAQTASAGALVGRSSGGEMQGETRMWIVGTLLSSVEMNGRDAGAQGGVGLTHDFDNGFKLGGGVFAGARSVDTQNHGNQKTLAIGPGVFVAYAPGKTGLRAEVGGMVQYTELDLKRGYDNAGGSSTSMGNTDAMIYGLSARMAYAMPLAGLLVAEPFVQYSWNKVDINGYTEKNGPFPATFDKQTEYINVSRLGAAFAYPISERVELTASAAWAHRFEDKSAAMGGTLIGVSSFNYGGQIIDKDWGEASLGAKWSLESGVETFFRAGSAFENNHSGQPDLTLTAGISLPL